MDINFSRELSKMGIVAYNEQENLWSIAKRCSGTLGIASAGAGAIYGSGAGSIVPGAGTLSGAVTGALAGLVAGTFACTMANVALRDELKKLAQGN